MEEDFFSSYLNYTSDGECPAWFHRWAAITSIGAMLGRQVSFKHGHMNIVPNMYCMLVGSPGTRKSTAIKLIKKLITNAGYNTIAAEKTTKEKFLQTLSASQKSDNPEDILDQNLWGPNTDTKAAEMYIMADEFNVFLGHGNLEFISLLGTLWDHEGKFENAIKNSTSDWINDPTISILGGNTPTNLISGFPPEIFGQGFFSRMLFIYGEPNGKRIAFPSAPDSEHTKFIVGQLSRIRSSCSGTIELTETARRLLKKIYDTNNTIEDVRFESYLNRRFNHLLKLCIITAAASEFRTVVNEIDVIRANTVLYHAEQLMPKALGEFGKAKHSDVSHKIITLLDSTDRVVTFKEIWKHVASDLDKSSELATLLQNLQMSDKIQLIPEHHGFLPKRKLIDQVDSSILDYSYLTEEEKAIAK